MCVEFNCGIQNPFEYKLCSFDVIWTCFQDHNFAPPKRELEIGVQVSKRFEQTYSDTVQHNKAYK